MSAPPQNQDHAIGVVTNGSQHLVPRVQHPHPRYGEARAKAHHLETSIEDAQQAYAKQLSGIIRKLQRQFYAKYGDRIQELEDLQEAIGNIQYSGMKNLKRQLTHLYMMSDTDEDGSQTGGGGGNGMGKEQMQQTAKKLYAQYKAQYFPADDYQRKRDEEARKLQLSIMGSLGGGGGGAIISPSHGYAGGRRGPPTMLGGFGHVADDADDDEDVGAMAM